MEGFRNFVQTMDRASDVCSRWKSADDGVEFSYPEMMLLAAHLDMNYPLDERCWYIVFPNGEIAMLNEDFEEILPMYLPLNRKGIKEKMTGDEFYPPEEETKFCMFCGKKIPVEAVYCPECGKKVK
ncbi:MAG: zinc ribbon domain-containing protein [Erysipelotrichaceae bacterium]|nr:zinc ribbon domain-containing protein [Erysipelotrichaceae bacterium]